MIVADQELMVEILDALRWPGYDCDHQGRHAELLDEYLVRPGLSTSLTDALRDAHGCFSRRAQSTPIWHTRERDLEMIISAIKSQLPELPRYYYHGTSSRHLASIAEVGLIPARSKTHWSSVVDPAYLRQGVFFTDSWRAAMNWAFAASHTLKATPKKNTQSAVLRFKAERLSVVQDRLAVQPDCYIVMGEGLAAADTDVLMGNYFKGFPKWRPLEDVITAANDSQTKRASNVGA